MGRTIDNIDTSSLNVNWSALQKVVDGVSRKNQSMAGASCINPESNQGKSTDGSDKARNTSVTGVCRVDDGVLMVDEIKQDIVCLDELTYSDLLNLCKNFRLLEKNDQRNLIE